MAFRYRFLARLICFAIFTCLLYGFFSGVDIWRVFSPFSRPTPSKEVLNSMSLSEDQCKATFPALTIEIVEAMARGPFKLEKEPDDYQGLVQARIKNGKVNYHSLSTLV